MTKRKSAAKRKPAKSKVTRTTKTTRTTRHKSMMTGKKSKSPFFIDDVPTLI